MNIESFFANHGFELSPQELESFTRFLELFQAYNSHTNLSAIRDEAGIIEKHFVDSLYGASVIEELFGDRVLPIKLLDIGSGGGFPGIPLKIVHPDLQITLLDSVGKKVKATNHFIEELGLSEITAIQERAEILVKDPSHAKQYDIVTSRATAYMSDILTWSLPFLAPNGRIILYKMPSVEERRDLMKLLKKHGLLLEAELEYSLAEKDRVIYVISKK